MIRPLSRFDKKEGTVRTQASPIVSLSSIVMPISRVLGPNPNSADSLMVKWCNTGDGEREGDGKREGAEDKQKSNIMKQ